MPRYELEDVRSQAIGRWAEIINSIAGIPDDYLTNKHNPCPKCGGNDRWRAYNDFTQTGGCRCNQCGTNLADGFAVISWYCGVSFQASLEKVAQYLGCPPSKGKRPSGIRAVGQNTIKRTAARPAKKPKGEPDKKDDLVPLEWNPMQVAIWCIKKKPITPESIKRAGGYLARYRNSLTVIVIPVIGEDSKPENWMIYNITGAKLPAGTKESREWIKIKNLNKNPGLAGSLQ